jgi:TolB-like protein/DNA-binding winged helix-turn-helix (wHTH) protein/Tfp pilus assembly protein PilF
MQEIYLAAATQAGQDSRQVTGHPMQSHPGNYRFGPYELRIRTRELFKHGTKLKLRSQPFQVLQALAERAGDVVTREELRELLWPKETFVDFEHGLNTSMSELRAVLSDTANHSRYIETLPKLGYRIIIPVNGVARGLLQQRAAVQSHVGSQEEPPATRIIAEEDPSPHLLWWGLALVTPLILVAAVFGYLHWSRSRPRPPLATVRIMLAVLPFENLTGDAAQEYFSDGLTEEMIGQLGALDPAHLGLIARTSVMHYQHSEQQLERIGRELGVQYVLEGSVRRDASKVRVSAQLIKVQDQTQVWARQYDRDLSSLLILQGEIAGEIAREIQIALGQPEPIIAARQAPLSATSIEGHDLYLKALYFWNKRSAADFRKAIDYFQQAIAKDPKDARAYAGLADTYALIGGYSQEQKPEYTQKARAAAQRALEIDNGLPEAHTAWALIVQNYDWDWKTAEKEFRRAIEINPNYATAHHWYAEHLMWRGHFDEALRENELARKLDPLSLIIATDNGAILYFSRRYDRAIEQFRYVLDLDPNFPRAGIIDAAYIQKGMYLKALADMDKPPTAERAGWYWSTLAYIYGRSGQHAKAQEALEQILKVNRRRQVDAEYLVQAYIGVGNNDQALTWLEWAASHQPNVLTDLKVEPIYDPLRSERRFQDLLTRVGLAD